MPITITKKKKFPSRELDQFTVRFPDGLRNSLAKLADRNNRSMNSEIVNIIQAATERSLPSADISAIAKLKHSLEIIIEEAIGMQSNMSDLAKQQADE